MRPIPALPYPSSKRAAGAVAQKGSLQAITITAIC